MTLFFIYVIILYIQEPGLFDHTKYLLTIAHPDDEVNCGALLNRLISDGKQVHVAMITNGDAGSNPDGRIDEMHASLSAIGIGSDHLLATGITEKSLLTDAATAYNKTVQFADDFKPDCILSIDFEGGHEGHDVASLIAFQIARHLQIQQIVYPDYHFRNMRRHGLEFVDGRKTDFELRLTEEEQDLKIRMLEAHRGQLGFYLRLQKNQSNYFSLLFEREVFRQFPAKYDFISRPSYQIGYEYHRNGFKFDDFAKAARAILSVS